MEAALVLQWSGGGLQYTKDSPFSTPLAKSSDQPFGVPKVHVLGPFRPNTLLLGQVEDNRVEPPFMPALKALTELKFSAPPLR
jgi:hypothetical protein